MFPLLALGGAISPHLEGSIEWLRAAGHQVSIQRVNYEFQRGACEMLRIQSADGDLQDSADGTKGVCKDCAFEYPCDTLSLQQII